MTGGPLVSVTVPCYNVGDLLGWALASLLAQTYQHWECIVVDDGSSDHPEQIVQTLDDGRIRYIRLERNSGRAVARQAAQDAAQGIYLAKLDADDWIYPAKLERQVAVMESEPAVSLLSACVAIEDDRGRLASVRARGVRGTYGVQKSLTELRSPPISHAASMIRMEAAKQYMYDKSLRRSEDSDFLLRFLMEHRFGVLNEIQYVYREYRSTKRQSVLDAYRSRMRMFWRYRNRYPAGAAKRSLESAAKLSLYWMAFASGQADKLINRRSENPNADQLHEFNVARSGVQQVYDHYFPVADDSPPAPPGLRV